MDQFLLGTLHTYAITEKDGHRAPPFHSLGHSNIIPQSLFPPVFFSSLLRIASIEVFITCLEGWRCCSSVWRGPPNATVQHRQPIQYYCSEWWKQPCCGKCTHKELLHLKALSLAEENPKSGNLSHTCLDIWIHDLNASSELKMRLWHLKLFLWKLHDVTNWRLRFYCTISRTIVEGIHLNRVSINSMAMKKIPVLQEICTCLSKVIILKLYDSVKANPFFWQKKKKGRFFTYTGGVSSIGTGHHAVTSQVLRVSLYCTHLPVWTPVEKAFLIQQTQEFCTI